MGENDFKQGDVSQEAISEKIYYHFGPDNEPSRLKTFLEFLIYFVGFLGTILALPQAYRVWFLKDAAEVSIIPWIALASFTPFWIMYGFVHKKKSLVMTYLIWFLIDISIVVGIMWLA